MDLPNNLSEIRSSENIDERTMSMLKKAQGHFEDIKVWNDFLQNSTNFALMISYDGSFIKLNKSLEKFLGYTTAELLTEPIEKVIVNSGSLDTDSFLEIPTTNYYFNYCFRCKSGKVVPLRCRLIPDAFEDCIFIMAWEI